MREDGAAEIDELIDRLRRAGVHLWIEGGKIRYRAPTDALTPDLIEGMREHKAALLAVLADTGRTAAAAGPVMPPAPASGHLPPSPEQRSLWLLDRMRRGNPCDHIVRAFRLRGVLDGVALQRSVRAITRRHDALRTTFEAPDGEPCLRVHESVDIAVERLDAGDGDAGTRLERASRRCAEMARRRFDLERGPLSRVGVLRLEENDHLLLIVMHHIVSDGRSIEVFLDELERLYEQFKGGESARLADLPVRHADYAAWRRSRVDAGALARQLAELTRTYDGWDVSGVDLAANRSRPARQTPCGARRSVTVTAELCTSLAALGRGENSTLFMTVLAAFQVLVYRCTGEQRIAIGTPMTLRSEIELEELIGLFVNMVVPKVTVSGELSFRRSLERARASLLEVYANGEVPFEELVSAVRPERDLSRNPLFQSMLQLSPADTFGLRELAVEPFDIDPGTSQFDLSLHLFGDEHGLTGYAEYDTDLFDAEDIDDLLLRFDRLLHGIVARPDTPIADLDLSGADERRRLLVDWNGATAAGASGETIHRLFESQAASSPEAIALRDGERTLTFAELDRRADLLAARIVGRLVSVSPSRDLVRGAVVGVCVERSATAVIALLAVLKSGGAYLPLEREISRDRLEFMLENAGAALLLSRRADAMRFAGVPIPKLLLDFDENGTAEGPIAHARLAELDDDAPAYVIYTSGSTGVPKGVVGTHRGAINRFRWMWETYPFVAGDVVAQKTSLAFVDHVWEVFGPLLGGVPLVVIREADLREPKRLLDALARERITHLSLVPSLLRVVLDAEPRLGERLPRLRLCISSGEPLPGALAGGFLAGTPDCRLLNLYGSSEVAGDVAAHEVSTDDVAAGTVPIGRPLSNVRLYVLDRDRRLSPRGLPGELYVGGVQLANGYLGHSGSNPERFVPDPFERSNGARLFRTGDIVRHRTDGVLEFIGRRDDQVKIRGVRIELVGIELALRDLPEVAEAVACVREDSSGHRRLVAHLVAEDGCEPTAETLRGALRRRLPDAMLPSAFHVVDTFPRTPSGKVDRQAVCESSEGGDTVRAVSIRTPVEKRLAEIWGELLRRDAVGRDDNFFDIGGDSLLAMMFVVRANRAGLRVSTSQLFEHQTIGALGEVLGDAAADAGASGAPPTRARDGDPFPLLSAQARFLDRGPVGVHRWNVSIRLEARGRIDSEALGRALTALVERHAALRSRFSDDASPARQHTVGVNEVAPLLEVDLSTLDDVLVHETIERKIAGLHATLDLVRGPVFRLAHFARHGGGDQLALVLHHLVCDRYSLSVLVADLETAYRQAARDGRVELRPEPPSLRRWVECLQEYARSPDGEADAREWLDARWHDARPLPRDHPAGPDDNLNSSARTVTVELSPEETRAFVNDRAWPLHERLLAALHSTLASWTGSEAVLVDLMHHGRDAASHRIDLSDTVGMFITYTPAVLAGGPARGAERASVPNPRLRILSKGSWSFGALHDYAEFDRVASELRRLPKPEVLFNHHGPAPPSSEAGFFRTIPGGQAGSHEPRGRREHLLAVRSALEGGSLTVRFVYSARVHRESTVARVAQDLLDSLRSTAGPASAADTP